MTEGRNTGFKKILDALEVNGSPKPEFETDDERSYFITRLFIHEGFVQENKAGSSLSLEKVSTNSAQQNERSLSEVLSKSNFNKVKKIISYIEDKGAITPRQAEGICNKSAATVRRYLKMLVETGYVEAQGRTNNSTYVIVNK